MICENQRTRTGPQTTSPAPSSGTVRHTRKNTRQSGSRSPRCKCDGIPALGDELAWVSPQSGSASASIEICLKHRAAICVHATACSRGAVLDQNSSMPLHPEVAVTLHPGGFAKTIAVRGPETLRPSSCRRRWRRGDLGSALKVPTSACAAIPSGGCA